MPHFGLIDEDERGSIAYCRMRSRIHVRTARRQMSEDKRQAAAGVLYDALIFGMMWYAKFHCHDLPKSEKRNLDDEFVVFALLKDCNKLPLTFDLKKYEQIMEETLGDNFINFDAEAYFSEIESVLTHLGILPMNIEELPPEPAGIY